MRIGELKRASNEGKKQEENNSNNDINNNEKERKEAKWNWDKVQKMEMK